MVQLSEPLIPLTTRNSMEKTNVIRSITEAFSMQPATLYVGMYWSWRGIGDRTIIHKIVPESVYIDGDPFDYYVGYDESGNRLFEYKKSSVNVNYEK